ncbi:MAG TPA: Rrf2 family transcriptional regulator, partial [Chroococcales cyanobacterium]
MISQTTEYGLRAVVFLAEHGVGKTTEEISKATQIPAAYLSKVLQQLARGNIVQSQRGLGGGFTLRKAAAELSVLEVVNAVDPIRRIRECPLGLDAHKSRLCALHKRLDEASALVEKAFAESSIADLISDSES